MVSESIIQESADAGPSERLVGKKKVPGGMIPSGTMIMKLILKYQEAYFTMTEAYFTITLVVTVRPEARVSTLMRRPLASLPTRIP